MFCQHDCRPPPRWRPSRARFSPTLHYQVFDIVEITIHAELLGPSRLVYFGAAHDAGPRFLSSFRIVTIDFVCGIPFRRRITEYSSYTVIIIKPLSSQAGQEHTGDAENKPAACEIQYYMIAATPASSSRSFLGRRAGRRILP